MITAFPSLIDVDTAYTLLLDYTRFHFPIVKYRLLDVSQAAIDDTHMEVEEEDKAWKAAVDLRMFCVPAEESYMLSRFGMDRVRDLVGQASVPDMVAAGIATQDYDTKKVTLICGPDDRFTYSGVEYVVKEVPRGPSFANTDIPIYFMFNCERHRPASPPHSEI